MGEHVAVCGVCTQKSCYIQKATYPVEVSMTVLKSSKFTLGMNLAQLSTTTVKIFRDARGNK